jgi:hypothetical protein
MFESLEEIKEAFGEYFQVGVASPRKIIFCHF